MDYYFLTFLDFNQSERICKVSTSLEAIKTHLNKICNEFENNPFRFRIKKNKEVYSGDMPKVDLYLAYDILRGLRQDLVDKRITRIV